MLLDYVWKAFVQKDSLKELHPIIFKFITHYEISNDENS